jgi:DNA-binding NarL/FixJ family response regulator
MLKVVVIDGNAISRNLLTSVLDGGGYDVAGGANTSSAGLANMIKLQPQVVCIDIGTTDDEGFGKLETLRTGLPKALVFLVSGKLEAATVQRALEHGVQGFIVKPFNGITVLATIRNTIIKLAKQHRQENGGSAAATDEVAGGTRPTTDG